ncbi:unnamed protein product [Rotaria sp. Silwood1]|nr:unnamed protein product [Rotaria sp. Silwood1]CAF3372630.1 unnamed protein product [Rotaria sp. Silwood1]CAF3379595.1 unnamed protein product [Rotaria sp. Silwood1]CAF4487314.1 unnamed protein product [Rotaria sp. Silwood1]CAF4519128.1 unnamed protein product [Rotaria sp. Silwood1]
MSHIGPAYGSLAANQRKIAAKRDPNLDREAQEWVEAVIGEKFPSDPYEDALKDGVILCKLMNKLQPGAIPKYATTGGAFKLRENISLFQNAARAYGLGETELFQTIDLFEKRNIPQVTQCIFALGRNAQKRKFNGPILGPKMSDANVRDFNEEQLRAGQSTLGLLNEGMIKGANQSGQNFGTQSKSENSTSIPKHQSQAEKPQIRETNSNRLTYTESVRASSELSDSSILVDDRQRSRSRQRQSQQRTLSSSSVENLLINLQNIQLPSSLSLSSSYSHINEQQEEDENSLQVLIDLARDTDSTRINKLNLLYSFVEDSIGMVELRSLLSFIKSSSKININEPPLNLYSSILPTLIALILLENDI